MVHSTMDYRRGGFDGCVSQRGRNDEQQLVACGGEALSLATVREVCKYCKVKLRTFEVLGRVFDADSLGKWIFDNSCVVYGRSVPLTDIAGDFWLMSLRLSAKTSALGRASDLNMDQHMADLFRSGITVWESYTRHVRMCSEMVGTDFSADAGELFVKAFLEVGQYLSQTERVLHEMHQWDRSFEEAAERASMR